MKTIKYNTDSSLTSDELMKFVDKDDNISLIIADIPFSNVVRESLMDRFTDSLEGIVEEVIDAGYILMNKQYTLAEFNKEEQTIEILFTADASELIELVKEQEKEDKISEENL